MAAPGREGELRCLKSRPELNGRRVQLIEWDAAAERWAVSFGAERKSWLRVRLENLRLGPPLVGWDPSKAGEVEGARFDQACEPAELIAILKSVAGSPAEDHQATATVCAALKALSKSMGATPMLRKEDTEQPATEALKFEEDGEYITAAEAEEATELAEAGAVETIAHAISQNILTRYIRMYGSLCLHHLWRHSALAREREEAAGGLDEAAGGQGDAVGGLETLTLSICAEVSDLSTVVNCVEALVAKFYTGGRLQECIMQESSFGRRAIKRFLPTGEDLLALLVRVIRHYLSKQKSDASNGTPPHLLHDDGITDLRSTLVGSAFRLISALPWLPDFATPLFESMLDCGALVLALEVYSEHRHDPDFRPGTQSEGTHKTLALLALQAMTSAVFHSGGPTTVNGTDIRRIELPDALKAALLTQAREACVRLDLNIPSLLAKKPLQTRRKIVFGESGGAAGASGVASGSASSSGGEKADPSPVIILAGLKKRGELNGTHVSVQSFERRKGRFVVAFAGGDERTETLLVRYENLRPRDDSPAARLALSEELKLLVTSSLAELTAVSRQLRGADLARKLMAHLSEYPVDTAAMNQVLGVPDSISLLTKEVRKCLHIVLLLGLTVFTEEPELNPGGEAEGYAFWFELGGAAAIAKAFTDADLRCKDLAKQLVSEAMKAPWLATDGQVEEVGPIPGALLRGVGSAGWQGVVPMMLRVIQAQPTEVAIICEAMYIIAGLTRTYHSATAAADPAQLQAALDRKREFGRYDGGGSGGGGSGGGGGGGGGYGGAPIIIKAMRDHPAQPRLAFFGVMVLGAVYDTDGEHACWREMAPQQATPGFADVIVRTLETHGVPGKVAADGRPGWAHMANCACLALLNICHGNIYHSKTTAKLVAKCRETCIAAGAARALARALRDCAPLLAPAVRATDPTYLNFFQNACSALALLTSWENDRQLGILHRPYAKIAADEGCIVALVEAMRSAHGGGAEPSAGFEEVEHAGMQALSEVTEMRSGCAYALALGLNAGAISRGATPPFDEFSGARVRPPKTVVKPEELNAMDAREGGGCYWVLLGPEHPSVLMDLTVSERELKLNRRGCVVRRCAR